MHIVARYHEGARNCREKVVNSPGVERQWPTEQVVRCCLPVLLSVKAMVSTTGRCHYW